MQDLSHDFFCFRPFLNTMADIGSTIFDYKSDDGMLGIRTRNRRMDGAYGSTELLRFLPLKKSITLQNIVPNQ